MAQQADLETGRVYLVGAGPGDPRLITVRGPQCLAAADVVFHDYLVNAALLEYVPKAADWDYDAPARFPGTLVFYMGVTTSRQWSHALLRGGRGGVRWLNWCW